MSLLKKLAVGAVAALGVYAVKNHGQKAAETAKAKPARALEAGPTPGKARKAKRKAKGAKSQRVKLASVKSA